MVALEVNHDTFNQKLNMYISYQTFYVLKESNIR